MMNPEVKAKWLERLRDPATKQVKGSLKTCDGFCCLGVLTDIYISEHPDEPGWVVETESGSKIPVYSFRNVPFMLPKLVSEWSGVEGSLGTIPLINYEGCKVDKLAILNDEGMSFSEIADVIEAHL